ncbi:MAG TPA: inorganic diphosphatase [Vicinamibacterales bacterium]|jgi:inorganic pyrophosphatase|nr:inorganic diphosphatase [Vicinamibacterales bacterium]
MRLDEIPTFGHNGLIHVVVESPRGATVKLKYDHELGVITLSRPLPTGLAYPHDWGFVPGTAASDGDPVDALVLSDTGTAPGVVIACRPIGVLEIEQNRATQDGRERNDRIIAVPQSAHRFDSLEDVCEMPERWRNEIAAFFIQSGAFERKDVTVLGWKGPDRALGLIGTGRRTLPAAGDR